MMDEARADAMTGQAPESRADAAGDALRERIIEAIRTVYDPEIPVNLYELGLIYRLDVGENGDVDIDMTLTAPNCPVAGEMPSRVQEVVEAVDGVSKAQVSLIFDPPWDMSRMSEDARLALDMF